eukprot:474188_1
METESVKNENQIVITGLNESIVSILLSNSGAVSSCDSSTKQWKYKNKYTLIQSSSSSEIKITKYWIYLIKPRLGCFGQPPNYGLSQTVFKDILSKCNNQCELNILLLHSGLNKSSHLPAFWCKNIQDIKQIFFGDNIQKETKYYNLIMSKNELIELLDIKSFNNDKNIISVIIEYMPIDKITFNYNVNYKICIMPLIPNEESIHITHGFEWLTNK